MIDFKIIKLASNNEISLTSGVASQRTYGINSLIQKIVKILLTTPETNLWYPGIGGGLKELVSRPSSKENLQATYGEIAIAVVNTERYLLSEQIGEDLNDNERLKALELLRAYYDESTNRWEIYIQVTAQSNETATVSLT